MRLRFKAAKGKVYSCQELNHCPLEPKASVLTMSSADPNRSDIVKNYFREELKIIQFLARYWDPGLKIHRHLNANFQYHKTVFALKTSQSAIFITEIVVLNTRKKLLKFTYRWNFKWQNWCLKCQKLCSSFMKWTPGVNPIKHFFA